MTDLLLDGAFAPFTMALALLLGLVGMEVLALLLGGSLLAGDSDADLDGPGGVELDADLDIGGVDLDALDGVDLDALDIDGLEGLEAEAPATAPEISGGGGVLSWLGIGRMPFLIWLGSALMAFGLSGMALQLSLRDLFQIFAPAGLVAIPAGILALWFARGFGAVFARLLPQTQTEALSEGSFGRRRGTVTQGTASRGRPAEVRVMDRFGNAHYLRAEPLSDQEQIAQGTEVLVIRDRRAERYVLVPLSD
ncbi:OB-fold-containig protein [Epibacterium sp. Ofav1-8]|uniref:OB-fold-containig protein n=1 Tax=Epibacterium sp. Ofav1-8 TaxID=2917735 RepID=UPI001EF3D78A|nr:OB-fold-containig protein [Epibacterium sp. Ofav1-8]MCG7624484.1 YqiJ family protein [Epibacterium sp. Ofav1-8]